MTTRISATALALSASAFIALAVSEHYTEEAIIPTKNDRPTVGFGSTFNADGSPVRKGDKIDPVRALVTAGAHIGKQEVIFRNTIPGVKLHQAEYDVYVDWIYQYGTGAWMRSSMREHLLRGEYRAACDALLKYKFSGGFDCSTPGNKVCRGVWTRQLERHKNCVAAGVA